jgi:hypothetical protein
MANVYLGAVSSAKTKSKKSVKKHVFDVAFFTGYNEKGYEVYGKKKRYKVPRSDKEVAQEYLRKQLRLKNSPDYIMDYWGVEY